MQEENFIDPEKFLLVFLVVFFFIGVIFLFIWRSWVNNMGSDQTNQHQPAKDINDLGESD